MPAQHSRWSSGLPKMLVDLSGDYTPVQAQVAQEVLIELGQSAALSATLDEDADRSGDIANAR